MPHHPYLDSPFEPSDLKWGLCAEDGEEPSETLLRYAKGALIPELERRYGPRRPGFNLTSIHFHDNGSPCIRYWYPLQDRGDFSIQLTTKCNETPVTFRAVFQLAHECLHALHPVAWEDSTVLEEGLAVKFSSEVVPDPPTDDCFYDIACVYATRLCRMLDDLAASICRYRKVNPDKGISDMRCSDLRKEVPQCKLSEFDELTSKIPLTTSFQLWKETLTREECDDLLRTLFSE